MQKQLFFFLICAFTGGLTAPTFSQAHITPILEQAFQQGKNMDILVIFKEKADLSAATRIHGKNQKAAFVFAQLQSVAERTQRPVRDFLHLENAEVNSFYIVNAISVKNCSATLARQLASFETVATIASDPWVSLPLPVQEPIVAERDGVEWGIEKINAPSVWALGYSGQGVTVGGADTGYDFTHPALNSHYRGFNTISGQTDHNYSWHDAIIAPSPLNTTPDNPCGYNIDAPCDDHGHGTHTAGTMAGDDHQGNQIGVAPGAKWIGCRNMERGSGQPSSYIECFEWFLAPTDLNGENPNIDFAPHVINNSWYCSSEEGCTDTSVDELIHEALVNLKASGVVVVVSNGNFGNGGCATTTGAPAYFAESFSVGSTTSDDLISNFSSKGPVFVDLSGRIKPDVSAPGQAVRSCIPGNNYAFFSGTSMAGPHVAGLVALILSANPALAGEVAAIENIIKNTCVPLNGPVDCSDNNGMNYPNNTFGYGRINALDAVNDALSISNTSFIADVPQCYAYPNPVHNELIVQSNGNAQITACQITDVQGRQVRAWPGHESSQLRLDLTGFTEGVYLIYATLSTGNIQTLKVVVQH